MGTGKLVVDMTTRAATWAGRQYIVQASAPVVGMYGPASMGGSDNFDRPINSERQCVNPLLDRGESWRRFHGWCLWPKRRQGLWCITLNGSAGQRDSPTSLSLDVHRAAQPRSAATAVRRRQGPSAATGKIPKAKSNARGAMLAEAQAAVAAKGSTLMPDAPAESGPSSDDEVMFTCDSACGPNELAA